MPYFAAVHAQDPSIGRVEAVLDAIEAAARNAGEFTEIEAAVAYASNRGVALLTERLSRLPAWESASKRFLISIDFGITEPQALARLAAIPNADVRVPNGQAVLSSSRLQPPSTFHPKGYLFRTSNWEAPSALVIGSANMSVSALATGSELITTQAWSGQLSAGEKKALAGAQPYLPWFDDAWASADLLKDVLAQYRTAHKRVPSPRNPPEERTPATRNYSASTTTSEATGALAVQLASASALWLRTENLYGNLQRGRLGNQLDTPRGTRVFFGFPTTRVPRNTIFGHIDVQVPGYRAVSRSVRFGNNDMDKVNLPVPGTDGPPSYDDAHLIFDRSDSTTSGRQLFTLTVTDRAEVNARIASAKNSIPLTMNSGREYGLLF